MYAVPGMFRDSIGKLSLRKKLTILVSVGVLLPLLVLTYMQYQSLAELQDKTKGAFKDNVRQGFTLVQRQMKQRLEDVAAQTLNPIGRLHLSSLSSAGSTAEIEKYFADVKRSHPEIEEIFVFVYADDKPETNSYAYLYSDKFVKVAHAEFTLTESHLLNLFEKARTAQSFLDGNRSYLFAHDSCTPCPPGVRTGTYLFFPLQDQTKDLAKGEQRGFAGVLLKESFVRDDLIARTIGETSKSHASNSSLAMALTISDENSQVLYSSGVARNGYLLESNFDRPFSNWKAAVGLKNTNLDNLARNSFLHSAGATVLVLVVLLGGIALTIRATDREARLAQAKSNFVANVSHELKTPLSLLSLFSEILELGRVKNEEKKIEYYRIIRHESLRLNKMIDNILDFSKIEAGRKTYNFAAGDMAEVIAGVLSSYRYQISNSGFDVQTNMQPELPPVLMDRDAMAQALSNLLDNAIKYSGEVKQLSITTKTVRSDLSIEIADHGIGIPRAEQAKIFEKFYRVGNGLVHDVKGSGLGLSLVKHIIEAHKGTISVESDVGKGSRFTILLPLARTGTDA
ncbi:MAG: two-component system, OmpR family, phosphate regulon sensor histidine kinase PhoR [Blastocatellia bacterium]|jgi:signal transduction histidine kinase|nr:two-component system, OmpR family, phosphate regulon sensor histidine kinase PhoR [Blastocatellia bacterium]